MPKMLDHALALAARGFHVFPLKPDRTPAIKDFPNRATRDAHQLHKWWDDGDRGIGVSTSRFGDDQALLALDVDVKNGKRGDASLLQLELSGCDIPATVEQRTPSGGWHYVFTVPEPMKQSVEQIAPGLDIRSRGGYIVAYDMAGNAPAPAPRWLIERVGYSPERAAATGVVLPGVDQSRATDRAVEYLRTAPVAIEGEGGDTTTYRVAAKVKDLGCDLAHAVSVMGVWNEGNEPPWTHDELYAIIEHAYRYGKEPQGSAAPEAVFERPPLPAAVDDETDPRHPAVRLNDHYAFIKRGAFVLQETQDPKGRATTLRIPPADLHQWYANKCLPMGDKQVPMSRVWMSSAERREFDAVVFSPGVKDTRFYNLWRGFTVEAKAGPHPSLDAFLEHALVNVCGGDAKLNRWLIGFFAHMVQRPGEKPLVALVFRGAKGTGKNALVERVGFLLGQHFLVADDERYLMSNFNGHLENNLFFVLDEASWAGDKRAEGKLKGLITGTSHNIERKGAEPYDVENLTRVAIIGNERWLVPATFDERRFAVFTVGDARRQDRKFFKDMRVGMEQGGYGHLLHYLLHFDLSGIDVDDAPVTAGLIDQKHASLEPVEEWWLDCIEADQLLGSTFSGALPAAVPTNRMREAFANWSKGRNIRSRLPDHRDFMRQLRAVAPSLEYKKSRAGEAGDSSYSFLNPGVARLRADWEKHIGGAHKWDEA